MSSIRFLCLYSRDSNNFNNFLIERGNGTGGEEGPWTTLRVDVGPNETLSDRREKEPWVRRSNDGPVPSFTRSLWSFREVEPSPRTEDGSTERNKSTGFTLDWNRVTNVDTERPVLAPHLATTGTDGTVSKSIVLGLGYSGSENGEDQRSPVLGC